MWLTLGQLLVLLATATTNVYAVNEPAKIRDIVDVLERVIRLLAPFAGLAVLWMVILAAFKFIRSGGDPKGIGDARSKMQYALIGAIFVAASWLIIQLISNLTGVQEITKVEFPN